LPALAVKVFLSNARLVGLAASLTVCPPLEPAEAGGAVVDGVLVGGGFAVEALLAVLLLLLPQPATRAMLARRANTLTIRWRCGADEMLMGDLH
jgi:hypothetical protein